MRSKEIEYEILKLTLADNDANGRPFTLGDLSNLVRQSVPDVSDSELVDTTKRLWKQSVVEPRKWSDATKRFEAYQEGADDHSFYYHSGFRLRKTPHAEPYFEQLNRLMKKSHFSVV